MPTRATTRRGRSVVALRSSLTACHEALSALDAADLSRLMLGAPTRLHSLMQANLLREALRQVLGHLETPPAPVVSTVPELAVVRQRLAYSSHVVARLCHAAGMDPGLAAPKTTSALQEVARYVNGQLRAGHAPDRQRSSRRLTMFAARLPGQFARAEPYLPLPLPALPADFTVQTAITWPTDKAATVIDGILALLPRAAEGAERLLAEEGPKRVGRPASPDEVVFCVEVLREIWRRHSSRPATVGGNKDSFVAFVEGGLALVFAAHVPARPYGLGAQAARRLVAEQLRREREREGLADRFGARKNLSID